VLNVSSFTEKELHFRNLYKAGQREVTDKKRKWLREKIRPYNERTFKQLELPLLSNPDPYEWLLNSKKRQ